MILVLRKELFIKTFISRFVKQQEEFHIVGVNLYKKYITKALDRTQVWN